MRPRRPLLAPLVPLYAFGLNRKNRNFDTHRTPVHHLQSPVISIGSISAGGAGKTPFLIALARLLRNLGYQPDVLSRGYGRRDRSIRQVDPAGTADDFGDEPLLLARNLGLPVFVGVDRFAAGTHAEQTLQQSTRLNIGSNRTLHLLDDAFSHRRLARTIDIALLTLEDAQDSLLPAGNLREPLSSLRRADILVLREDEAPGLKSLLANLLLQGREHLPGSLPHRTRSSQNSPRLWTIRREFILPDAVPSRPLAFCGIARPADFLAALQSHGITPLKSRCFRDHHRYIPADAQALSRLARSLGANGFLTTAKDSVKLDASFRATLQAAGPLAVADIRVILPDEQQCAADLELLLKQSEKQATE